MDIKRKDHGKSFFQKVFILTVIAAAGFLQPGSLHAEKIPSYKEAKKILPEIWKKKYPVEPIKFIADPQNKGILTGLDKGKQVFYYHFMVIIPRPVRNEDESIKIIDKRKAELWMRYRPSEKNDPWDLTFARIDLLPGTNKRWIKD